MSRLETGLRKLGRGIFNFQINSDVTSAFKSLSFSRSRRI